MPRIEVIGSTSRRNTPKQLMADMLRYDEGEIEKVDVKENKFIAIVQAKSYTKDRWSSFGMRTKLI